MVAWHTDGVASKYDLYWAGQVAAIRIAVERGATGRSTVIRLAGLSDAGDRESWYGVAEVRGGEVTGSSMAYATALGTAVAASGACARWPQSVFRFAISAAGDVLAVSVPDLAQSGTRADVAGPEAAPASPADCGPGGYGQASAEKSEAAAPADAAAERLYLAPGRLGAFLHGTRRLRECCGGGDFPRHGVYFFYEPGEVRADGSDRIVRVGTHALTATSQATLWGRLRQHRGHLGGSHPGGGNHRASVFRRHVGAAQIRRQNLSGELLGSWLDRHGPRPGWETQETQVELEVSDHIRAMPFLWLSVPDAADRSYVEANCIALASRLAEGQDSPSPAWLGRHADRPEIRESGLWNIDHVRRHCDPAFPDLFEQLMGHQH
jgi:hypothetical protein